MTSIGDTLKNERDNKGLSIEDVARDTNIARKYLIALEEEDFAVFPAEAYMLGFLKNYGEYLGVDIAQLQSMYRVLKIQEQPVPEEQLLYSPSKLPAIIITIVIIIAGISLAGGAAYLIINMPKDNAASVAVRQKATYQLSTGTLEKRFFPGDIVFVTKDDKQYKIEIGNLSDLVNISTPVKDIKLSLNDEVTIDINSDGVEELRITASDYSPNRSEIGALLRIDINTETALSDSTTPDDESVSNVVPISSTANSNVIFSGNNPYPFTLQIVFQGYCMFRWEILREAAKRGRNERYFVKGDELIVQAENGVRLWISNAHAVRIQVIGGGRTHTLELGSAGEVVVDDISWIRDENGRYALVLNRLET